ncbi:hypothetical protein TREMEDRAFT_61968 [Tremella mesenterica DSM 1558]|uniref:uncharacterized protein n=1 Tax=Tremella mesenterica (strain ATCC 24925 / CBS 8224 / DSM 1558 / NBRC 9311 / NRRL Y-6157 / RJB 2259-6 / UBC 559-6) TaxID=578456 RepID=UPI0003F49252|nr:uncharacterized protein TREMEDRAFT_61968 [Tremella mesenterica DSM 1558]EIW70209.1 hypothetical protein TREMEDRAFT_61968 [Tremella mesenterica DSM 1558]
MDPDVSRRPYIEERWRMRNKGSSVSKASSSDYTTRIEDTFVNEHHLDTEAVLDPCPPPEDSLDREKQSLTAFESLHKWTTDHDVKRQALSTFPHPLPLFIFQLTLQPGESTATEAFIVPGTNPSVLSQAALQIFKKYRKEHSDYDAATVIVTLVWDEADEDFKVAIEAGATCQTKELSQAYQNSLQEWFAANPTIQRRDPVAVKDLVRRAGQRVHDKGKDLDLLVLQTRHPNYNFPYDKPLGDPSTTLVATLYWYKTQRRFMFAVDPPRGVSYTTRTTALKEAYAKFLGRTHQPEITADPCRA